MIGHFATAQQQPGLRPCLLTASGWDQEFSQQFPADQFVTAYRKYLDLCNSDQFDAVRLIGPGGVVREYGDIDALDA